MFSSKKKVDKDKKKNAAETVQVQMQQSSSTSVQTSSHSSSSSSYTINTSTSLNNTDFPRLSLLDRPSFARGVEGRASTTRDWKPFPSGGTSNKDNIKRRVADWERRSTGSFENKALPPPPTDALRMISNVPPPYRTAFGNTTTANYPNNFTPTITSGLVSSPPASVKKALPSIAKRDGEASQFLRSKVKIKVVKTRNAYYDPANSQIPTYNTTSKNRGKALIVNNMVFHGESEQRHGAEFDEYNISELFKQMGFKVEKHRNKTKSEMTSLIENYRRNKGLAKYDINVVVIMSHGCGNKNNSTEIAAVDEKMISTAWIIDQFDGNNCPSLIGKPKIFIFQCCRGDQRDIATDAVAFRPKRTQADLLMAYSTIPGYVSHRDPNLGTWYIQAICNVFMEHAHNTDVESLLKIVDEQLANIGHHESQQTSSYENRGFKRCFFHPM